MAVGAGASVATAAPASVSISATMVLIGTVCPSVTLIAASTPAAGDGISASTLSVEISKIGSSRATLSPAFLSHLVSVPSAMLSPIWGMITSTRMAAPCSPFSDEIDRGHQPRKAPAAGPLVGYQPSRSLQNLI